MNLATYPDHDVRPTTIARPIARRFTCERDGKRYVSEFDCPCWTDLGPVRARELRADLEFWHAGFLVRHPEFAR